LIVSVKNQGRTVTNRVFTPGSAHKARARGSGSIGQNALHHEDWIKVTYIPASSSRPLGFFKSMTMPDGRVVNISAGKPKV
jgi:hypothetical protein